MAPTSSSYTRSLLPRNKMSITQTYYLAHSARSKLSKEAARADHDLRLLVGHANLLDSLMLDLANAEKEQERWFNSTVRNASKPAAAKPVQHIRWADSIEEESVEDYSDDSDLSESDSDSDSDYEEEEEQVFSIHAAAAVASLRRPVSPPPVIIEQEVSDSDSDSEDDLDDDDDEEEAARLTLTRSPSRTSPPQSPPELLEDISSDSEEESMPPSPTQIAIDTFVSTTQNHPAKRNDDDQQPSMFDQAYIEHQGTMIPAF